jgi:hypothetical protein
MKEVKRVKTCNADPAGVTIYQDRMGISQVTVGIHRGDRQRQMYIDGNLTTMHTMD